MRRRKGRRGCFRPFRWPLLYIAAAIVLAVLGFIVIFVPRLDLPEAARQHWLSGFVGWIGTWKAVPLVVFVLTYKMGEFAIGPMVKPFWVDYGSLIWVDRGELMFQIGLIPTTFGIVLSVAGRLSLFY